MKAGFESSGYKPEVQPLKFFQDDYGLKLDGDEGDDDDDDDEEEDDDEDDEDDSEEEYSESESDEGKN